MFHTWRASGGPICLRKGQEQCHTSADAYNLGIQICGTDWAARIAWRKPSLQSCDQIEQEQFFSILIVYRLELP